jgi:hypothetical protein
MKRRVVSFVPALVGCLAVASISGCGSDRMTGGQIPGMGLELPLQEVDGHTLPFTVSTTGSDQTVVEGGKATLGEAIQGGGYAISLRRTTGATSVISMMSGGVIFDFESGSGVAANIDLGPGLGVHLFRFHI